MFRRLHERVALERGRLFTDALLLVEQGHAHRLRTLRLLDLRLALEGRELFADRLLLGQERYLHRPLPLRLAHADLLLLLRARHLHRALALRFRDADLAEFFLLGDVAAGLLHRLRRRLAADRLDVAGIVLQVRDVHVDEHETDLLQLGLE